ncbi:hypothetical protein BIV08_25050 [Pseudomonas sp. AF76]|nr:hypothetical protein BIV08_25050 [Pseudomonas sp. AF76]
MILPDEIKNGIGPGFSRATVCVSYPYCRAHDRIRLNCNGKDVMRTVLESEAPAPPDHGSATPTTICFDVTSADLGEDHPEFMFSFTVTDQLGNSPDLDSPFSAVQIVDVDQAGLRLPVPIPREIGSDTGDDPSTIDLDKLGTNPLLLIVLTGDSRFLPGDTIEATYVAKVVGQPEVIHSETGTVETDGFGQKQACVLEIPNDKVIPDSTVEMSYKLFRGTTLVGTSKTAHASVIGAAQNLLPPSVKEANGTILNPVQAKDSLHVVVPANAALLPDDKLKVTWTGAPGTPAGGSHTSGEWPVRDGWEVPIPNSVVAFNLGKSVTVTYTVIQNGVESPPSDPFVLNVQAMPVASLTIPLIPEAAQGGLGTELDLSKFTGDARVTVAPWPLIAAGQRVWLSCEGIASDGSNYTIPLYAGSEVSSSQVTGGLSMPLLRSDLEKLRDGSELKVVLLVTFNRTSNQSEAVIFPLRIYIVRAVALIAPTITDISDSQGSVVDGTTVETSVVVTGTGNSGQQIQLIDVDSAIGNVVDIPANTTAWNTTLAGLTARTYSLKARALYGSGQESAVKSFTVVEPLTIDPTQMVLSTWIFLSSTGAVPPNPAAGAFGYRQPTGGVPPYQYSSSAPHIAHVDVSTGKVTSFGNGAAIIYAVDQKGNYTSYPVAVSNVFVAFGTGIHGTYNQCNNAAAAQGGRLPTRDEWHRMRSDYNGAPGVSPNWSWSSTAWGIGYVYGIQTETGAETPLESVLGKNRADGFGIRAK